MIKKKSKSIFNYILSYIKTEYKFILMTIFVYIILFLPVNYYITIGGGISDIDSRIKVENAYEASGTLNISYVEQVRGKVISYILSYIIPDWEAESYNSYKYTTKESIEDIEFRSDLDLTKANNTAIMWAYKLANKSITTIDTKIYVITKGEEYPNPLKVQDQILSINNKTFNDPEEYKEYLQTLSIDEKVIIRVKRKNKEKDLTCQLYEYKDKKILGIALNVVTEYETSPKVELKFKEAESGPSGGLITTLAIYNKLTEDDITKGLKIAGTGTIEEDGSIGQIGGIKYKLLGASKDNADIFIAPAGKNYEECLKIKKAKKLKIKIISASNIEEVIEKLRDL